MIGRTLEKVLTEHNHTVAILTRRPTQENHIFWNPDINELDTSKIDGCEILINLCGENIGAKRWTEQRKKVLHSSRIHTTELLYQNFQNISSLRHYISASGINCYPIHSTKTMSEEDAFGSDYLSQLVKDWETAAQLFEQQMPVCKLRISMVLDKTDGALQKLLPLAKLGIASPFGSGKQWMSWVHIHDVVSALHFAVERSVNGSYNLTGKPVSNALFTEQLMHSLGKKMWFPKVPAFLLKAILGEQSTILLDGTHNSNSSFKEIGFQYQFEELTDAFSDLFHA